MSVTRIEQKFAQLKQKGRSALVTYTMAGDPDYQTALNILKGLPEAGADIIELGLPFSDPMADGSAIQAASIRALGQGMTTVNCLDMVREFRKSDSDTPIILMGYYNPIYINGVDKFLSDALAAGADGLIIVDLPPEEDQELALPCKKAGMACIHLATPTTDDKRLGQILENASGFLYYVSIAGITGTREPDLKPVEQAISMIRQQTDLPVAVGFGIKTPEMAGKFAKISDAVVVGSAIVNIIKENLQNSGDNSQENLANSELESRVLDFVNSLAKAVQSAKG